jgi:hypothetical protein
MSHDAEDAAYFRRRSEEERQRARACSGGAPIQRLHLDLAERYNERVREMMERRTVN